MSDSLPLLVETAGKLFAGVAPDAPFEAVWPRLDEAGFPLLLASEDDSGFGGDFADAAAVFRLAGFHALPAPLAEAVLARWAAAKAGLSPDIGVTTLAAAAEGRLANGRFTGTLGGVPWGETAGAVLFDLDGQIVRAPTAHAADIAPGRSPAGEPRARLRFEAAEVEAGACRIDILALGAFARSAQIGGALDAALALSIAHANERQQFGRPIGKFQAIQQNLAVLAEEAAAANSAAQAAALALDAGDAQVEIAAAKLRANIAAGRGGAIAHQVHGAIGFTAEHRLHHLTRRLIAWRSEFGADRLWSARLAAWAAQAGVDGFWAAVTARPAG